MIYLLTAIGLSPGGSSTVHIYTQTVHRRTQNKQYIEEHNNLWECGPCPVLARFTLAFALQLRKKHDNWEKSRTGFLFFHWNLSWADRHNHFLTPRSGDILKKLTGSQLVKKFPAFYRIRRFITHSQVPATCPYPEPARSIPYSHIQLPEIHLNFILQSTRGSPKLSLSFMFPHQTPCIRLSSLP